MSVKVTVTCQRQAQLARETQRKEDAEHSDRAWTASDAEQPSMGTYVLMSTNVQLRDQHGYLRLLSALEAVARKSSFHLRCVHERNSGRETRSLRSARSEKHLNAVAKAPEGVVVHYYSPITQNARRRLCIMLLIFGDGKADKSQAAQPYALECDVLSLEKRKPNEKHSEAIKR